MTRYGEGVVTRRTLLYGGVDVFEYAAATGRVDGVAVDDDLAAAIEAGAECAGSERRARHDGLRVVGLLTFFAGDSCVLYLALSLWATRLVWMRRKDCRRVEKLSAGVARSLG